MLFDWLFGTKDPKADDLSDIQYPITGYPVLPDIMKQSVQWKIIKNLKGEPVIGMALADTRLNLADQECLEMIRDTLLRTNKDVAPDVSWQLNEPFPTNVIAISYSEKNFEIGDGPCQFKLAQKFQPDGYFTYQMLSENLQSVYYNENGTTFHAGLCYFPTLQDHHVEYDRLLITEATLGTIPYPLQDQRKTKNYIRKQAYGRYCESAGRNVAVQFDVWTGELRHFNAEQFFGEFEDHFGNCVECSRDFFEYRWENTEKSSPHAPLTVLQIFESAGITFNHLHYLKTLPMHTKIPMIHKTNGSPLPESNWPEVQEILLSVLLNPDWIIDPEFTFELKADQPVFFDAKTFKFSKWLLFNPWFEVESKMDLMTQLMRENSERPADKASDEDSALSSSRTSLESLNNEFN